MTSLHELNSHLHASTMQVQDQTYHKSWGMPHSQHMESLVQLARQWAFNHIQNIDYDDLTQELYLKALEFDEMDYVQRPGFVMKSMQNAAYDLTRKELKYKQTFELGIEETNEIMNLHDSEFVWTQRLLSAALVAFIIEPSLLPPIAKDQVYQVYKQLTRAEHRIVLRYSLMHADNSLSTSFTRIARKYIACM